MTTVSLRMDDDMKRELDAMCEEMGMNISTFYMIYTKKVLRDRKIPFEIEAPMESFYTKQKQEQLEKSEKQVTDGKVVKKTRKEKEEENQALKAMKAASRMAEENGISDMTLNEINAEITETRK